MGNAVDVLVGLAALFFAMSTLASAVLTGFQRASRSRQKTMFRSVAHMLDGTPTPGPDSYTADFYAHEKIRRARLPPGPLASRIRVRRDHDRDWSSIDDYRRGGPTWLQPTVFTEVAEEMEVDADERVFAAHMAALNDRYRAQARIWLFVIGLVGAVVFNVEMLAVARALWEDDAVRDALRSTSDVQQVRDQVALPIGWRCGATEGTTSCAPWKSLADAWPEAIAGWLLTAIAVSLGAPFWYDAIRLVGRRRDPTDTATPTQPASERRHD